MPVAARRGSAAVRLLGLRVRIPPGAWMRVSCKYCVLSGRGLCDAPITRAEESYRSVCVIECDEGIGKGKVHPRTGHEGPEGELRYSSTLSLTSALDEGRWSTPRPGRFTPGKETRYALYRRLGRPQGRSERVLKISTPPGFDPRTVQLVASRYTDCAIPAHLSVINCNSNPLHLD